uniref:Sulfotransferase domain-containing protein n=1 Tax=Skeletonema marinoi TaxID=267567 RepID=A0A7S2M8D7_9STRA
MGCSLGFLLHCHDDVVGVGDGGDDASIQMENHTSSSLLAKLTTHIFHKDVYNCDDDAGYILFIVRDPVARALSAFNYDKPNEIDFLHSPDWAKRKAHFYSDCPFYQMEDFVQNGLREEGDSPDRCKRWAKKSIQGINTHNHQNPDHWYFNYQYYLEAIPSDSKILTIRNERIEEDIRSIEDLFECHEQERLALAKSANVGSDQDRSLYLSDESISILCQALCNEIQFYKKILHRAINMSEDQLRVSLMELEAKCPHEAIAEECLDVIPDISEKLRDNRGY